MIKQKRYYSLVAAVIGTCMAFPVTSAIAADATFTISFSPESGSIVQGASTNTSVNITGTALDSSGRPTPIKLAVSQGLPVGITVSFNPTQCTPACNSIMTVTAASTAPPGTYIIPIVGAAAGMTASASYSVTVSALPTFDYSASLSSNQGSAATGESIETTINLYQLSGTSNTVTLSASGQPSGVTVKFSTQTCKPACSALVTINVQSLTSGTYPITISATAGSLTRKATYSLTIVPSALANYSLSVYPTSNTITKSSSVNTLINLTQLSGTSQTVTFTVSNAPINTTAKINPTSCKPPCNAVLTVTTNDKVLPGTYPITVLGFVGGVTKSVDYNLIVTGPIVSGQSSSLLPYTFTRSLYRGISGTDVTALQQYLAKDSSLYPEGTVTGYFGALTEKAVQRFQAKNGVVSSGTPASTGYGFVGAKTRAKLNSLQ